MPSVASQTGDISYLLGIIDVVREGIICANRLGTIRYVNRTGLSMWGYGPHEILGASLDRVFAEDERGRCDRWVVERTLERGDVWGEFLFCRKDGSQFLGSLSGSRLDRADGEPVIVLVVRDLTEQKKLQRRLLESQKMAFLGKVVDGLSHEIRNPIVTLGGYARRLERVMEPEHPGHEYLRIILGDVERMEALLRDIDEYVQFAQAHPSIFARVNLHEIVDVVLRGLRIPETVRIEQTHPADGPWIYGDAGHLRELFHHLVENGLEAMPTGGVLRIESEVLDARARVRIEDTGIGIPETALPHLYSPFFTTKTKGAGVGLAKAHIIVQEHSGQIDVRSEVDKGTTFELSFPLDRRQRSRTDG